MGERREDADTRVCVGAVAGAFGVRGEARLKPFTADPTAIASYGALETEDGSRRFDVRITRSVKGGLAARLSGVSSREAAEALKGVRLYAARSSLPPTDEEEFYHADLIGLAVVDLQDAPLGRVSAVHDFGAGDVLEIEPAAHGKSVFLPFTRDAAPHVDLSLGVIVADPPEGVFADGAADGRDDVQDEAS